MKRYELLVWSNKHTMHWRGKKGIEKKNLNKTKEEMKSNVNEIYIRKKRRKKTEITTISSILLTNVIQCIWNSKFYSLSHIRHFTVGDIDMLCVCFFFFLICRCPMVMQRTLETNANDIFFVVQFWSLANQFIINNTFSLDIAHCRIQVQLDYGIVSTKE